MSLILKHKKYLLVLSSIIMVIVFGIIIYFSNDEKSTETIPEKKEELIFVEETPKEDKALKFVDIKGEVKKSGVYQINDNARVIDIIKLAGGLTKDANTSSLNLSKLVFDEMVIIVHSNKQINDFESVSIKEEQVIVKCNEANYSIDNDACINVDKKDTLKLISINQATKEELMTISGIGEKKALDIINYRTLNGGFNTIDDIKNVSGIGDSLFAQIKDFITT